MKFRNFSVMVLALAASAAHAEPLEMPGSTWAYIVGPSSSQGDERNNVLLQGKIEQGIVWFKFGEDGKWKLNTFAALSYSLDSKGINYNNKAIPAVGVKISRDFENGVLDLGVQAVQENRWKDNVNSTGVQAFASFWFGWNLKK